MNYLENSGRNDFVMCDDKTGAMLDVSQRLPAVETLTFVHEVYAVLKKSPDVPTFEVHFALRALCQHLGWSPGDIALVEHYALATQAIIGGSVPTTG